MAKTKDTTTKTYIAKTPIHHDGEPYEIGAAIELTDAQAEALLAAKAAEPAPAKAAPAAGGKA